MGAARIVHRENERLQPAPTAPTRRRCAPQRGSTPVGRSAAAPRKYCSVPKCTGAGRSRRGACARPASGAGPKRPLRAGRARGRRWPGPVFRARSVRFLRREVSAAANIQPSPSASKAEPCRARNTGPPLKTSNNKSNSKSKSKSPAALSAPWKGEEQKQQQQQQQQQQQDRSRWSLPGFRPAEVGYAAFSLKCVARRSRRCASLRPLRRRAKNARP